MHRKKFLAHSLAAAAGLLVNYKGLLANQRVLENYQPVSGQRLPCTIKSVELLVWKKNYFVVVTNTENQKGITLCNARMQYLTGIFNGLVAPFFIGKDANSIETLVNQVYLEERNYKFSGMPFWNCVGHIEIAIWDLLGKVNAKPVYELLGNQINKKLPVYLSSLTRENRAEEEVEKIIAAMHTTGCQATKIKVGGRMKSTENDIVRSREIVSLLRKNTKATTTIYADANGSFTVAEGIAMGQFLEANKVDIFEEPCPWEDFEANNTVAKALSQIKLAGGEQDTSYHRFSWYCTQKALDILQPDVFYNGGIIRTLAIAKLCEKHGLHFAPHSPKADSLQAPFLHLMAVAPAMYGFQEYPLSGVKKPAENWWSGGQPITNGHVNISNKIGLGIDYDETIFNTATKII